MVLTNAKSDDAFRTAWGELFVIPQEQDEFGEREVYDTFLRNTPPPDVEAFQAVYSTWHGGVFEPGL